MVAESNICVMNMVVIVLFETSHPQLSPDSVDITVHGKIFDGSNILQVISLFSSLS